ncbi:MAG: effector-associated domain EAD1-containing protein [Anaerolineae bacterium]|nr:effector-associated domain EAD1-containing protein [Anaerolineae bacterium]
MRLKPEKYTQLHTALCKAFNPNSFTSMLKGGLGLELTDVSSNNAPFPTMCGDVIRWAEERDRVEGLIAAAYSVNDTNRRLQQVRDEFDATWFQTDTTLEDPRDATQFDHRNQTIQGHQVNVDGDATIDHIGDVYHQYYGSVSDQDKVSEESKRPLFYVDFLQNERFKGRERELAALHAKLQQENAVGIRPAAAVSGMGGIGKTQLAVEYVYRYRDAYPGGVAWLNAAERLRPQLLAVARDLHLTVEDPQRPDFDDQLLVALTNYLSANPQTLFVYDNVDDPVLFAQRQLGAGKNPLTFGGTLLLTTRRRDFPTGIEDFNLKTVDLPTARAIVSGTRHGMADDPDLDALCDMLGLLPLALNLAAAALRDTDASIADYMADLKELGADRYAEEAELSLEDYYAASLTPALEAQWRGLENDKTARHLFAVAGQLHEAAVIPVARLGLLAGVRDRRSIKKLTRGVQALVNACLVEQLAEGQIRLHPLVQEFAEARVESAQRHVFRLHCARNLRDAYWGLEEMQRQYVDRGALALQEDLLTALDLVTFQQTAEFGPEMSGLAEVTRQLGLLLRTLQREIHTLLQRDLLGKATRFAQQMQYRVADRAIDPLRQQAERLCGNLRGERWRTLLSRRRESPALERTLAGHAAVVRAVAVTQDGRRAVSAR